MRSTEVALNAIDIELIANALRSVVDEAFVALMKTAYSTNIKERHDHSTCIMDLDGRVVVQASMAIPVHISSRIRQWSRTRCGVPPNSAGTCGFMKPC